MPLIYTGVAVLIHPPTYLANKYCGLGYLEVFVIHNPELCSRGVLSANVIQGLHNVPPSQSCFTYMYRIILLLLVIISAAKMSTKAALVVPALRRHTSTVIVAHGLGDR